MLLIPFALCAFGAAVYVTGMHDASNTVAVPVRTRALGERSALYLAALFNVLGVVHAGHVDCRSERTEGEGDQEH